MYNQNTLSRRFDIKVKYLRQNKLVLTEKLEIVPFVVDESMHPLQGTP